MRWEIVERVLEIVLHEILIHVVLSLVVDCILEGEYHCVFIRICIFLLESIGTLYFYDGSIICLLFYYFASYLLLTVCSLARRRGLFINL